MHPAPTPEQLELMQAVERFCQEQITPERLAAWERLPRGIDDATWRAVTALGWLGIGLPERVGGSGMGLVEVACLLRECARGLIPRSVIGAIRGGWALARLDPHAPELDAVAQGTRVVALALDEQRAREPLAFEAVVQEVGGALRVAGEKWFVANGIHADLHIVAVREGAGVSLVLVDGDRGQARALRSFDGEEQAVIRYDRAPVLRRLGAAGGAALALAALRREQTALGLAEMIGGMQAVLDMTVAYVKEREQFGQKLAVFQAVQHQIADMATAFTAGNHLAWQAITRVATGTEQVSDVAIAAAFVGQAFKRLTFAGHHLHGGAGYVVEHPMHWHAERAQTLCIRYAPEIPALEQVAAELLD